MKSNKGYASAYWKAITTLADVSNSIWSIHKLAPRLAVIYARVSTRAQREKLQHQIQFVADELRRLGFEVIAIFQEEENGWVEGRPEFTWAVATAKRHGAVLVAQTVNRFWRNEGEPDDKWSPLSVFALNQLLAEANGVQLATVTPPDASPSEEHGAHIKRGQRARGNVGGRPPVQHPFKERRLRLSAQVIEMRRAGHSYRQIKNVTGVPRKTASDWFRDSEKTAQLAGTR
jgi:DNA invertase Pin-like site-specific DNA recombinase